MLLVQRVSICTSSMGSIAGSWHSSNMGNYNTIYPLACTMRGCHIIAVNRGPSHLYHILMGSTNTSVPLYTTGTFSVQVLCERYDLHGGTPCHIHCSFGLDSQVSLAKYSGEAVQGICPTPVSSLI